MVKVFTTVASLPAVFASVFVLADLRHLGLDPVHPALPGEVDVAVEGEQVGVPGPHSLMMMEPQVDM